MSQKEEEWDDLEDDGPKPVVPPRRLFHGTHTVMAPGDLVLPRDITGVKTNYGTFRNEPGYNLGSHAYATDTLGSAQEYANDVSGMRDYDEGNDEGTTKPVVYHVEPVNAEDLFEDRAGGPEFGNGFKAYKSPSGFRVVQEAKSSGVCRSCNILKDPDGKCGC